MNSVACLGMPEPSLQSNDTPNRNEPCEFHLHGFITGSLGLGEAARMTLRHILQLGHGVKVVEISTGDHRMGNIREFEQLIEEPDSHWPGRINLFHVNPPEAERYILDHYSDLPLRRCLNVAVPFWELPALPPSWLPNLNAMDCILAPTHFIREVMEREFPGKPVIHYPQSIPLPQTVEADRSAFGLPEDAFILLCGFDVLSDAERKNPWACIRAFQLAFPDDEEVRLVIKVSNASVDGVGEKLNALAAEDPRIVIIDEIMTREKLQRLYASCDALVSLHRSEGLGLFIMEMMAQAKPCIVTAWSGNMDFTTKDNACLVDYRMVPVNTDNPTYAAVADREGIQWAEADEHEAAKWMGDLAADSELRKRIGSAARQSIMERSAGDCREVFEQLRKLHARGLQKPRPVLNDFGELERIHCWTRIKQAVKTFISGKSSKS